MIYYVGCGMVRRLFGTDGVRGIVNKTLTAEMALRLGYAIGTYLGPGKRILLCTDARYGGEMISRAVIAGLTSAGVKVYEGGLAPTPACQLAVRDFGFDGGVMITASHNPPEYNGIKFIASDGIEAPREVEEEIESIYFESRFRPSSWMHLSHMTERFPLVVEHYVKSVASRVDKDRIKMKGFKVVVDPANNVGSLTTPRILRELGVKVLTVNADLHPLPYREPEPTPKSLKETAEIVKVIGANLGVGHDGDADRAVFIDEKGSIVLGDRSAIILAKYIKDRDPDLPKRVVTAVSSGIIVEEVLKPFGIEVVWTRVGSPVISRVIQKMGGAICGFEENGSFIYPKHQLVRDGAMTTALMLELLAVEGKPLSALIDELPKYYTIKTKVPMTRENAEKFVEEVKELYKGYRQITIDGVKVIGDDFWVLVRPSGTEPIARIMLEAKSEEKAKEILNEVMKIAERYKS